MPLRVLQPAQRTCLPSRSTAVTEKASLASTATTSFVENGSFWKGKEEDWLSKVIELAKLEDSIKRIKSLRDFFEESRDLVI